MLQFPISKLPTPSRVSMSIMGKWWFLSFLFLLPIEAFTRCAAGNNRCRIDGLECKDSIDNLMALKMSDGLPTAEEIKENLYKNVEENPNLGLNKIDFREHARRGLTRFQNGDVDGAIEAFSLASQCNNRQPLQQRGIILYCAGQYEAAAEQLEEDIIKIEQMKFDKATELRLWHSACLYKLGRKEKAMKAVDPDNRVPIPVISRSKLMNETVSFFAEQTSIESMLSLIGDVDVKKDPSGMYFFGNFWLGLYYDAIGQMDLSKVFLSITNDSPRYKEKDMWYRLPRVLYANRFPDEDDGES